MNENFMYESMSAVAGLNRIEGFEPKQLMRNISDEENNKQLYLDVQFRKLWFRLVHTTGKIHKRIVNLTDKFAIVEARIYLGKDDDAENYVSNAFAQRFYSSDGEFGPKYLEMAETAAVGRALADAGFGSQFADMEGDTDPAQVDAGVSVTTEPDASQPKNAENIKQPNATANGIPYQPANSTAKKPGSVTYTAKTDVDTILSVMTLDDAKKIVISAGVHKGKTLQMLAVDSPKDLKWYVEAYRGPDNILRAGAKKLLESAIPAAS